VTHPRWEEFEGRLEDLQEGEFKLFGEEKLKKWLEDQATIYIKTAERLHKRASANGDPQLGNGFFRAVADAEKCLSLLYILEGRQGSNGLPCALCAEIVEHEFTVPNYVWNAVVRGGEGETDKEYLCAYCYIVMTTKFISASLKQEVA
jgi:hypothetical protein